MSYSIREGLKEAAQDVGEMFVLPDMSDAFMVMPASVALQLFAYYVSADKGFDVDKPEKSGKGRDGRIKFMVSVFSKISGDKLTLFDKTRKHNRTAGI